MKDNIEKIEYKEGEDFFVTDLGEMKELHANNYCAFVAAAHWAGRNSYWLDWESFYNMYNTHKISIYKKSRGNPNPPKPSAKKEDKTDDKAGNTSPKKGPTKSSSKVSNKKS